MNRNRGAGKTYILARKARHLGGSGGMVPQKFFKSQGVSGAFWCDFELRAQLTSALHTRKLRACESQQPRKSAHLY